MPSLKLPELADPGPWTRCGRCLYVKTLSIPAPEPTNKSRSSVRTAEWPHLASCVGAASGVKRSSCSPWPCPPLSSPSRRFRRL